MPFVLVEWYIPTDKSILLPGLSSVWLWKAKNSEGKLKVRSKCLNQRQYVASCMYKPRLLIGTTQGPWKWTSNWNEDGNILNTTTLIAAGACNSKFNFHIEFSFSKSMDRAKAQQLLGEINPCPQAPVSSGSNFMSGSQMMTTSSRDLSSHQIFKCAAKSVICLLATRDRVSP